MSNTIRQAKRKSSGYPSPEVFTENYDYRKAKMGDEQERGIATEEKKHTMYGEPGKDDVARN
jgi:hypothetical protein